MYFSGFILSLYHTFQWLLTEAYLEPCRTSTIKLFLRKYLTALTILTGKDWCFTQYRNGQLAASDFFHMFTQSIKFYIFQYQYRCLKNVIPQIDSKNEWLLLSASFTAKFGLVFVLTLENAFSQRFHFQANRKSIGSSKKRCQGFSKQLSV